jgi:uncharacterized membrane protein
MLLPIHVAAGGLALVLGVVALLVTKGGAIHRRSGLLFVCAMFVMGISAAFLGNVGGGLMTIYFVATALTTVRGLSPWTGRIINIASLTIAAGLAIGSIMLGVEAFNSPRGFRNGVPFQMHFFIAIVLALSVAGDVRIMRFGAPRGGPRLARHLWRMCFALFIAAGSFFSVRERVARVVPEPFTTVPMRVLPIVLVFGAMFYWLWRVRGRRTLAGLVLAPRAK